MMNLTHWRLVVATADLGNLTKAAEQVGITQSGASQAITQLESVLGVRVFARSRKEVTVTALGERIVQHAREMLENFDEIRTLANSSRDLANGRIRLGSFPSVLWTVLPTVLRSFELRHPGIEVVELRGTNVEVEDWISNETVDLGGVLNPPQELNPLILGRDEWVVLLPNAHPFARRSSKQGITMDELSDQPFVLATGGCSVNGQSLAGKAGVALNDVRLTVRDWGSACGLVRESMGITVVPESSLPTDLKGLRSLPLSAPMFREFGLVRSAAGRRSLAVSALWDHIEASVS